MPENNFNLYISLVKEQALAKKLKAYTQTFGCAQNEADSEIIRGICVEMGYLLTNEEKDADLIIFNTCAIRETAEQRVFGRLGEVSHFKKANKDLQIILCGCMSTTKKVRDKVKKSYPYVNLLISNNKIDTLPKALYFSLIENKKHFELPAEEYPILSAMPRIRNGKYKTTVSITYGCNNFCSYCIVPYVRGRERSRDFNEIYNEVKGLVDSGHKDITLLGQNVNSYAGGCSFPTLLEKLANITGDFWLRFMSSHPKDASKELFDVMARNKNIAKHLHLPFQSGSDRILTLMNRKYTINEYIEKINYARSVCQNLTVTSDVIVGFSGETLEDYNQTLDLIKNLRFDALFTFIYSPRDGTKAAELIDNTPRAEKQRRFEYLLNLQNNISNECHKAHIGKTLTAFVEERNEKGMLAARTDGGRLVLFDGSDDLIGKFTNLTITGNTSWAFKGSM